MNKFIKNGRVYWITPKPQLHEEPKKRPAIALFKYGYNKHVFLQMGTKDNKIPSDLCATKLLRQDKNFILSSLKNSILHLDISKPEINSCVIKPHINKGSYLDIDQSITNKLRAIYYQRRDEISVIRIKNAKIYALMGKEIMSKKQLFMLKNLDPLKHKNMNIDDLYEKFKEI